MLVQLSAQICLMA